MSARSVVRTHRPYVGGDWVDGGDPMEVADLAEGGVFAEVACGDASVVDAALDAATTAQPALATSTIPERANWLSAISTGIGVTIETFTRTKSIVL